MNFVAIPKFKFIPPHPMPELEFEIAKGLQDEGSKSLKYLHIEPLLPQLKIIGLIYGGLCVLWMLLLIKIYYLPTSGAQDILNLVESFFSIATIGMIYFFWGRTWRYITCRKYNKKLHRVIKKSNDYQEFLKNYKEIYY
jgi:hypothetical protein